MSSTRTTKALLFALALAAQTPALGCGVASSAEEVGGGGEDHGHHEHAEAREERHDGEEHGDEQRFDRALVERLRGRTCEHDVSILDCDECRYEVGAVEVAPELLRSDGDDLVRTARLARSAVSDGLLLTGEVAFDEARVAHVSPRVEGVSREVFVRLGDRVEQGARLVAMDSLELGRLRADYLKATARADLARKNFERERRLHEKRIASGREKLQAETAFREARIELEGAQEQLRLLGLATRRSASAGPAPTGGGQTVIRSPVAGRVVSLHAVRGERLSPETSVATVADLSRVWVWADAYERDLALLLRGSATKSLPAQVRASAFEGETFPGVVDYVGAVMEEATRTVKVRVEVDNAGERLRPGMFVDVIVDLGEEAVAAEGAAALTLPAEAVTEHEGQSFVFVKVGPTRFLRRDVRVEPAGSARVRILSGLEEGEEVVVRGVFLLKSDILREQMGAGCAH